MYVVENRTKWKAESDFWIVELRLGKLGNYRTSKQKNHVRKAGNEAEVMHFFMDSPELVWALLLMAN